jgi:hypothetical protein
MPLTQQVGCCLTLQFHQTLTAKIGYQPQAWSEFEIELELDLDLDLEFELQQTQSLQQPSLKHDCCSDSFFHTR